MSKGKTAHLLLKKHAKQILRNEGFKNSEIFFEHFLKLKNGKYLFIDVVGINNQKKVFIECGSLQLKDRLGVIKEYWEVKVKRKCHNPK